jgi:hypothetical protein
MHLIAMLLGDVLRGAVVHCHGMTRKPMLLLQVGKHQEKHSRVLGRTLLQRLFEEVAGTLKLATCSKAL